MLQYYQEILNSSIEDKKIYEEFLEDSMRRVLHYIPNTFEYELKL